MDKQFNFLYLRAKAIMQDEKAARALVQDVNYEALQELIPEDELYEELGKRVYRLGSSQFREKKEREAEKLEIREADLEECTAEISGEQKETLVSVLEKLPDLYLATVMAFYYDCMSPGEVAEVMDCTVQAVQYRLNYTRKCIEEELPAKVPFSADVMKQVILSWMQEQAENLGEAPCELATTKRDKVEWASFLTFLPPLPKEEVEEPEVTEEPEIIEEAEVAEEAEATEEVEPVEETAPEEVEEVVAVEEPEVIEEVEGAEETEIAEEAEATEEVEPVEETAPEEVKEVVAVEEPEVTEEAETVEEIEVVEESEPVENSKEKKKGSAWFWVLVIILILGVGAWAVTGPMKKGDSKPAISETNSETQKEQEPEEQTPQVQELEVQEPETQVPTVEETKDSTYLIEDSNKVLLKESELRKFSKAELRLARNEIYARYGVVFDVKDLDEHFGNKSWYTPKMTITEFYDKVEMNMVEEQNVILIQKIEQEK